MDSSKHSSKRIPATKFANEIVFSDEERNSTNPPILVPMTESEVLNRGIAGDACGRACGPMPIGSGESGLMCGIAPAAESNSASHELEHVPTGHEVSTAPADEASIPSLKSSKKNLSFINKGIFISAVVGLASVIVISGTGSWTHILESYGLRDVSQTSHAESSPERQSVLPVLAAAPPVSDFDGREIVHQLTAIARDLSIVQRNVKELIASQEQIRSAQNKLTEMQSQLAVLQAQAHAKQNERPSRPETEGRNRHRRGL
jgi:hypothetical protein